MMMYMLKENRSGPNKFENCIEIEKKFRGKKETKKWQGRPI